MEKRWDEAKEAGMEFANFVEVYIPAFGKAFSMTAPL